MFTAAGNCTVAPTEAATDPGIAGTGVLLSFIVTAGLAVILSAVITFHELRRRSEAKVLRKLLLSLSDQQIITGIGIQSVGLAKMQTMVPYHFFIIWMLSLLATSTHLATLLALVNDFRRDWVLRWLRQFLMFINLVLSSVFGIFILMSVMKDLKPTLPIACVWELPSHGAASNSAISVAGTIATLTGNGIVFALGVWYLHSQRQKWLKMFQTIGLIVLIATGAGAAVRVILLSQAFGKPNLTLVGTSESDWSFGQLLPMLLLLLPLVSAIEIIRGEMKVPAPVVDDNVPLIVKDTKSQGHELFQPNPFWGQSRFSK